MKSRCALLGLLLCLAGAQQSDRPQHPHPMKKTYGDQLVFHGGINAVLWDDPEAIKAEMESVVPILKEKGGYIFSSDHSVPSSVSLTDFRHIVELAKILGSY